FIGGIGSVEVALELVTGDEGLGAVGEDAAVGTGGRGDGDIDVGIEDEGLGDQMGGVDGGGVVVSVGGGDGWGGVVPLGKAIDGAGDADGRAGGSTAAAKERKSGQGCDGSNEE